MNIRDIAQTQGVCVGKINSKLFDCDIDVMIECEDLGYAEKCVEYFNSMSDELISALKKYTLRYCEDFRQFFDEQVPEVPVGVTAEDIFDYVSPNVMIIRNPRETEKIGFSVEFGCSWEPEHGMEWAIKDGKILYVGDFSDVGAWCNESVYSSHCMNYVFKEHCMD